MKNSEEKRKSGEQSFRGACTRVRWLHGSVDRKNDAHDRRTKRMNGKEPLAAVRIHTAAPGDGPVVLFKYFLMSKNMKRERPRRSSVLWIFPKCLLFLAHCYPPCSVCSTQRVRKMPATKQYKMEIRSMNYNILFPVVLFSHFGFSGNAGVWNNTSTKYHCLLFSINLFPFF